MKTKLILIVLIGAMACSENVAPVNTPVQPVDYPIFYSQLAPYGSWINYAPYGSAWLPSVAVGFTPYLTNGYWFYSNYGWTWYSYYSWGWAPFHYGRWHFDVGLGWLWIPDTMWGPGWVAWRMGGGYCGWAPLGPNISVNLVITGGHVIAHDRWIFVRNHDFANHQVEQHRVDRTMNPSLVERSDLLKATRGDRNSKYLPGPDRNRWQQQTGQTITPVEIRRGNKPGRYEINNNRLEMYRPSFDRRIQTPEDNLYPNRGEERIPKANSTRERNPLFQKRTDQNLNIPRANPRLPRQNPKPTFKSTPRTRPNRRGN